MDDERLHARNLLQQDEFQVWLMFRDFDQDSDAAFLQVGKQLGMTVSMVRRLRQWGNIKLGQSLAYDLALPEQSQTLTKTLGKRRE